MNSSVQGRPLVIGFVLALVMGGCQRTSDTSAPIPSPSAPIASAGAASGGGGAPRLLVGGEPWIGKGSDIFVWNPDGRRQGTNLTNTPIGEGTEGVPEWSPDRSRIAFRGGGPGTFTGDIFVMQADGSDVRQVTDSGKDGAGDPSWAPDGKRVVFTRSLDIDTGNDNDLFIVNVDTGRERRLTNSPRQDVYPVWSPTGRWIAFSRNDKDGDYELYLVRVADGKLQRLTDNRAEDQFPAWSPDGTEIAFVRSRGMRRSKLIIVNKDGSNLRKVSSTFSPISIAWAPGGRRLAVAAFGVHIMRTDGTGVRRISPEGRDFTSVDW